MDPKDFRSSPWVEGLASSIRALLRVMHVIALATVQPTRFPDRFEAVGARLRAAVKLRPFGEPAMVTSERRQAMFARSHKVLPRRAERGSAGLVLWFLIGTLVWLIPSPAAAAPGDLDSTFGNEGMVITGCGVPWDDEFYGCSDGYTGRAYGVVIQADGKIVAAGTAGYEVTSFGLARHQADGALDATFGGVGALVTTFAAPAAAYAVAIQADGKIVAVGTAGKSVIPPYTGSPDRPGITFALARYNADGTLDPSFGTDGKVRTGFGRSAAAAAYAVAIQPDGKLVAVGLARKAFALARYNVDGSLDTSFSLNGKARTRFVDRPLRESATDVAIQADGGILVSGIACDANGCNLVLARYLPDGSLDAFFGAGGGAITPISWYTVGDLAVQADGKIVVGAGHSLFRYDPNGSLDTSFSDDGWVRTAVAADGVGIQSDGKIVVTGPTRWEPWTFAVARFDPSGALDRTFGGGRATTDFPGFDDLAYALAIQADGKIVAVGTTSDFNIDGRFALARFLPS